MPVAVSVMVTVPENDVSACVSCHDIGPAPDESDAEPVHVPLTFDRRSRGARLSGRRSVAAAAAGARQHERQHGDHQPSPQRR